MIYIFRELLWLLWRERILRGNEQKRGYETRLHNNTGDREQWLPAAWWLRKWRKVDLEHILGVELNKRNEGRRGHFGRHKRYFQQPILFLGLSVCSFNVHNASLILRDDLFCCILPILGSVGLFPELFD